MLKSRIIKLPKDSNTREKLERKLEQYRDRIDNYPDMERVILDSRYKIAIVEELLDKGKVKEHPLAKQIQREYGSIDEIAFDSAYTVIEDYCKTGGKHVMLGSGFR